MFKSVWKFFSGKKTAIGAALMVVAQFVPAEIIPVVNDVAANVGAIVASVGLVHKGVKQIFGGGD